MVYDIKTTSAGIVDSLKRLGTFIVNLFRWKRQRRAASGNPAAAKPASTDAAGSESEGGRSSRSSNGSQNAAASVSGVREMVHTDASHHSCIYLSTLPLSHTVMVSLSLSLSLSLFLSHSSYLHVPTYLAHTQSYPHSSL